MLISWRIISAVVYSIWRRLRSSHLGEGSSRAASSS